jgi:hypothetical protein
MGSGSSGGTLANSGKAPVGFWRDLADSGRSSGRALEGFGGHWLPLVSSGRLWRALAGSSGY